MSLQKPTSPFTCCGEVPFHYVVRFLDKMSTVAQRQRDAHIKLFLERCVPRPSPDVFQIFRLLLPLVSWAQVGPCDCTSVLLLQSSFLCRCPVLERHMQHVGAACVLITIQSLPLPTCECRTYDTNFLPSQCQA